MRNFLGNFPNTNIYGDFQICSSVPLRHVLVIISMATTEKMVTVVQMNTDVN